MLDYALKEALEQLRKLADPATACRDEQNRPLAYIPSKGSLKLTLAEAIDVAENTAGKYIRLPHFISEPSWQFFA
jgi:hypothetical protein